MNKYRYIHKFRYAFSGLLYGFKDTSILLQWIIALLATILFAWLDITLQEWALVVICFGVVLALEYMNTVIEHIMDFQHHQFHPSIRIIKDLGAASVLVAAMMALVVGMLIVLNHL